MICGLLNAAQCPGSPEASCPIAALQAFSDAEPGPALWLAWVNWVPGLVYGALFSVAIADWHVADHRSRGLRFALASGLIYLLAGPLFSSVLVVTQDLATAGLKWLLPAGLVTGCYGAFGLAAAATLLWQAPGSIARAIARSAVLALVGGIAGLAFVATCFFGVEVTLAAWPAAFVMWQVPVGLALRRTLA